MKNYQKKTVKAMFKNGVDFKNIVAEVKFLLEENDLNEIEKIIDTRNKLINKEKTHEWILDNLYSEYLDTIFEGDNKERFNLNCMIDIANRAGAFYHTNLEIVLVTDNVVSLNGEEYHRNSNDPFDEISNFYGFCLCLNKKFKM